MGLLLALIFNTGCIALNPATIESIKTASAIKTGADGAGLVTVGKTINDMAASKITNKNCSTLNTFLGEDYCKDKVEEQRYTGFTCGTTAYSDWPCMDAKGCMVK